MKSPYSGEKATDVVQKGHLNTFLTHKIKNWPKRTVYGCFRSANCSKYHYDQAWGPDDEALHGKIEAKSSPDQRLMRQLTTTQMAHAKGR